MNYSRIKTVNLGLQDLAIKKKFPSFKLYKKDHTNIYWIGELKTNNSSLTYTIKINYHPKKSKVFVLKPSILKTAPHLYRDHSLCLYHPNDGSYRPDMLIADTILPWTCEWLYFYTVWLEEGIWWGKSAPHNINHF